MAVPTTLSGAEMTRGHRHARGVDESVPRVRPAVVVFDPALAASQPEHELAASSLNALGHAVEGPCTVQANPVATLAAHEAARLIAEGWARADGPDRDALALGALLAGYTIDSTGLGLHHVLAQTLVRVAGTGHGPANAVMLPHTLGALAWRFPDRIAAFGDPVALATQIRARTGADDAERPRRRPRPTCPPAPTPQPPGRNSPTRRRPPTAPRSSRCTRARSDTLEPARCGNSGYRGLVLARPVDDTEQHVACSRGTGRALVDVAAGGPGRRTAAHTTLVDPYARRGPCRGGSAQRRAPSPRRAPDRAHRRAARTLAQRAVARVTAASVIGWRRIASEACSASSTPQPKIVQPGQKCWVDAGDGPDRDQGDLDDAEDRRVRDQPAAPAEAQDRRRALVEHDASLLLGPLEDVRRQFGAHARSGARRAVDRQLAVERSDPISQAAQPASVGRVGTAGAVVGDLDDEPVVLAPTATVASSARAYFATFVSASETTK